MNFDHQKVSGKQTLLSISTVVQILRKKMDSYFRSNIRKLEHI